MEFSSITFSNWLSCIKSVLLLTQIIVIIYVAKKWKSQKRLERYADQCNQVLKNWHNINHYWCVLSGTAMHLHYGNNEFEHSKRFFENNKDSIVYLDILLKNPDIYINEEDKTSMNMIKKTLDTYAHLQTMFNRWYSKHQTGIYNYIMDSVYKSDSGEVYKDIKEKVERIKKSRDLETVKKEKVYVLYQNEYKKIIDSLKKILLDYVHYKKN